MQFQGGIEMGIDTSYRWYGENTDLIARSQTIANDDGSNYPVHFIDNNGDGLLSNNDNFQIFGTGPDYNGPAESGWTLQLQFDPTGDIFISMPIP